MSRNLANMPHIDKLNHVPKYPNKRTFVYQNRKRLFKILYLTLFALAKLKAFPVSKIMALETAYSFMRYAKTHVWKKVLILKLYRLINAQHTYCQRFSLPSLTAEVV